ncbi:MAG: CDP-alcohol phosphatidyltransferase family protein [Nanoarchaeota archaeon]|nr:CDP-alcohol phosphatidyltransferase family protein [Nanoarchaeota archaeon]MBU1005600.1 CDP-alcohol phosphatidyltransferase family protein [Nanoarchaeota archaeon]MBU1945986.1 CDP-alcohol phosphatidyltransferase family protein [Nanoarchaeota archaeon]
MVTINYIAKYYIFPLGKAIAKLLKNTPATPNSVTLFRALMGLSAAVLLYQNGFIYRLIFAAAVIMFYAIDVTDGILAGLKNMRTKFGEWIDGVCDKIVMDIWVLNIAIANYLQTKEIIFIIAASVYFLGKHLYIFASLRSDICFQNHTEDKLKKQLKQNLFSRLLLFFVEWDIQIHFLVIASLINMNYLFLFFYAAYFNVIWVSYIAYYFLKYLKEEHNEISRK